MPDRWGRPTFEDGMGLARGFMQIKDFQGRQKERGLRLNDRKDFETTAGMSLGAHEGQLAKSQLTNLAEQEKDREAETKIGQLPDQDVLAFQPSTLYENKAYVKRMERIRNTKEYRREIETYNKKAVSESYVKYIAAFKGAKDSLADKDIPSVQNHIVKIGEITNNPYRAEALPDGTVNMYWIKDGEKQPMENHTVEDALELIDKELKGEKFFEAHQLNREASREMNLKSAYNPTQWINSKGEIVRSVIRKNLNSNQVEHAFYDKNGDPIEGITNIDELRRAGWQLYNPKTAQESLTRKKTEAEIAHKTKQTELLGKEKGMTYSQQVNYNQERRKNKVEQLKIWGENNLRPGKKELQGNYNEQKKLQGNLIDQLYQIDTLPDYRPPSDVMVRSRPTKDGKVVYFNMYDQPFKDKAGKNPYTTADKDISTEDVETEKTQPKIKANRQLAGGFSEKEKAKMKAEKKAGRDAAETVGEGLKKVGRLITKNRMPRSYVNKLKKKYPDDWEERLKGYEEGTHTVWGRPK